MDHECSERNAKRVLNHSQDEQKETRNGLKKEKSVALPAHLKPKFTKKHKKKREKSMSRESEEEPTGDKKVEREREKERDEDDRQQSIDKGEEEEQEVRESERETGTTGTTGTSGTTGTTGTGGTVPVEVEQPSGDRKKKTVDEDEKKGNAVAQFVDEPIDIASPRNEVKKTNDFWEEGEKKRKEELKNRLKEASGRTKKNKKSDRSPRNKPGASMRKHTSKRHKKKKDGSMNIPPTTSSGASQGHKPERSSDQGHVGNQGMRRAAKKQKTSLVQKLDKTMKKTGKKTGFFKSILDKTKFWSTRKSDCAFVATKELITRSYVPQEYDQSNPQDFEPPPASYLSDEQLSVSKNNSCISEDAIFVNKRPFWLTRGTGPEDVLPKPHLNVIHRMSSANLKTVAEPVKRGPFMDPKTCALKDLMVVDQAIGWQQGKASDEAKCVAQNTFAGTILFQSYKSSKEAKKKLREMEARLSRSAVKDKSVSRVEGEKWKGVTFSNVPRAVDKEPVPVTLNKYHRKERPVPPASRTFTQEVYFVGLGRKPSKRGHVDAASDNSNRK